MHRIDSPNATPSNQFQGGNTSLEQLPTEFTPEWCTDLQENVCRAIEGSGAALVKGDHLQLLRAIRAIVSRGASTRNVLVNAGAEVSQRTQVGSVLGTIDWVADRWKLLREAGGAGSMEGYREDLGGPDPSVARHFRLVSSGATVPTRMGMRQRVEGVGTLENQKVTLSCWFQPPALAIGQTARFSARLIQHHALYNVEADANDIVYNLPEVVITGTGLTQSWQRYEATVQLGAHSTVFLHGTFNEPRYGAVPDPLGFEFLGWLEVQLVLTNLSVNATLRVAHPQLEAGDVATTFDRKPFDVELQRCLRFYERSYGPFGSLSYNQLNAPYLGSARTQCSGTRAVGLNTRFLVTKAKPPTVTWYNPATNNPAEIRWGAANVAVTATNNTSINHTGDPQVGSSQADGLVFADWIADAELG